ncbi:hypothetical protein [Liberiplasma polymorphum]
MTIKDSVFSLLGLLSFSVFFFFFTGSFMMLITLPLFIFFIILRRLDYV